jgi:hypothetical protein
MNFFKKLIWILGIVLIFSLIAITNIMDRNRFIIIKDAVISIYEDRLIAKNIIVNLSHLVYEKEIASAAVDTTFFNNRNKSVNKNIDELVIDFQTTKLTSNEDKVFARLQTNFNSLKKLESKTSFYSASEKSSVDNQINEIQKNLADLSDIQLEEGKRQLEISKNAVNEVELFTKAENIMLIILGIILLIVVFFFPKKAE